jgi:hypothetical protein
MSPYFFYSFALKMSLWDFDEFPIIVGTSKTALRTTQHKKIEKPI